MQKKYIESHMTLIELLIVLALMAGLAGMALSSVSELNSSYRYDETRARMNQLRLAIVGDRKIPGQFILDMGRLPIVQDDTEGKLLSELWANPSTNIDYGSCDASALSWPDTSNYFSSLPTLSSVNLKCGWNGPYINVFDPDDASFYDGFGYGWLVATSTESDADTESDWTDAKDATIYGLLSRGSDAGFNSEEEWDAKNQAVLFELPDTEMVITVKALDISGSIPIWKPLVRTKDWEAGTDKAAGDYIFGNESTAWTAGASVALGDIVEDNDYVFKCIDAGSGTNNTTAPTWNTDEGETTTDVDIVWECLGKNPVYVFICTDSGETGSSEPDWNTTVIGTVTTDNAAEWKYIGLAYQLKHCVNRLRVALFVPSVASEDMALSWENNWESSANSATTVKQQVTFSKLFPGVRKVYAYAYRHLDSSNSTLQISGSEPETVNLEFGSNFLTLYLR